MYNIITIAWYKQIIQHKYNGHCHNYSQVGLIHILSYSLLTDISLPAHSLLNSQQHFWAADPSTSE